MLWKPPSPQQQMNIPLLILEKSESVTAARTAAPGRPQPVTQARELMPLNVMNHFLSCWSPPLLTGCFEYWPASSRVIFLPMIFFSYFSSLSESQDGLVILSGKSFYKNSNFMILLKSKHHVWEKPWTTQKVFVYHLRNINDITIRFIFSYRYIWFSEKLRKWLLHCKNAICCRVWHFLLKCGHSLERPLACKSGITLWYLSFL